uniref:Dynein regulatory complex protein 1/2 N-terminal domain-containing protein n=1 Tax=Graphocephala atropunctata TaxID=36148 RepID=A0A1B6LQA5_9HEMI
MPLTEEEKKKKKAEKKAQKLKEAEELRIKTRKDELAREVKTSQGMVANRMKLWYMRNYAARFPLIQDDMEMAWHSFEYALDVKDFIVCQLQHQMEEAKLQEAVSWQDFVIKIDDMIGDYLKRLEGMDNQFQARLKNLLDDSMEKAQQQEMAQTDLVDYYKTVLYIMEEQFQEVSSVAQGEYMTKRDEEAKRGVHVTDMMSAALESTVKKTTMAIKECLQHYKETTETRRKQVDLLRAKDSHYLEVIRKLDVRLAKLSDDMSSLQSQVSERFDSQLVLDDLKRDIEETYSEYTHVRANLNQGSRLDATQLLNLTTHSNDIIKHLEHVVEKGEKILRLGVLCRNLETQEEKVVPFGMSVGNKSQDLMDDNDYDPFVLFWRRFANANLIKQKLEPKLKTLQYENECLNRELLTVFEILSNSH